MGDGDHGLALHQGVEIFLNGGFDLGVERTCRLVKNQDRGVLEQHAGDGDALALAAGKFHATLAHMGVVTLAALGVDKVGDEFTGMGFLRCRCHLGQRCIGHAVAQIIKDRTVEQRGILGHHANFRAQGFLRHLRDVLAINADGAALEIVKAQQQVGEGGFARTRAANKAHFFAGPDGEGEAIDDVVHGLQPFPCHS